MRLLHTHLRGARKRRQKRYGAYDSRGRLAGMRMLSERPAEVEARDRVGLREADTVMSVGSWDCVVTRVERKTGLVRVGKLKDRTAGSLSRRLTRLIRGAGGVETVTADSGTEFHDYRGVERHMGRPSTSRSRTTRGSAAATRTPTGCCASTCRRARAWRG